MEYLFAGNPVTFGEVLLVRAARILLVEDEVLIALSIQQNLRDVGGFDVVVATDLASALALAAEPFDAAILDINIHGCTVFRVADILVAAGVPVIFSTAYSTADMPGRFACVPMLRKPVPPAAFIACIEGITARNGMDHVRRPATQT